MFNKKEEMGYHVAKKYAQQNSKQSTVSLLVSKNSQVITLSNSIGEKNMHLSNGNLVIQLVT